VDAIARGGTPGDLYLLETERDLAEEASIDPHSMNPYRVLALTRSMGEITNPVYVVGCEPDSFGDEFEGRMGLSSSVAAAIPEAIRMVMRMIRQRLPVDTTAGRRQ
jgi:hydrogenase maturation protease